MRQWRLLDNSVGRSQTNQQRMENLVKRHKRLHNQPKIGCEASGGAAPGDTLNKALQTLYGKYYFLYFRRCENMVLSD